MCLWVVWLFAVRDWAVAWCRSNLELGVFLALFRVRDCFRGFQRYPLLLYKKNSFSQSPPIETWLNSCWGWLCTVFFGAQNSGKGSTEERLYSTTVRVLQIVRDATDRIRELNGIYAEILDASNLPF